MLGIFSSCAGCRQVVGWIAKVCDACGRSMHGGCRATAGACTTCGSGKPPRTKLAVGSWLGICCAWVALAQARLDALRVVAPPRASSALPVRAPAPSPVASASPVASPVASPSPSPVPSRSPVASASPSPAPSPLPLRTIANADGGDAWSAVRVNAVVVDPGEKCFVLEAHLRPGNYHKLLLNVCLNKTVDVRARRIRVDVASGPGGAWERIPDAQVSMVSSWRWSTVRSPRPFDRVRLGFEDVANALKNASRSEQGLWLDWIAAVSDRDDRVRVDTVAFEVERIEKEVATLRAPGGSLLVPVPMLEECVTEANRAYSAPDGSEGVVTLPGSPQLIPWPLDTNVHHLALHLERHLELAPEERASWFWREAFARALRDVEDDPVVAHIALPEAQGEVQISRSGEVQISGTTTAAFSLAELDDFIADLTRASESEIGMRDFLSARVPRNWMGWTRERPALMARAMKPLRPRIQALLAAASKVRIGDRFSLARTNDVWVGRKSLVVKHGHDDSYFVQVANRSWTFVIPAALMPSGRGSLQLERVLRVVDENRSEPGR